MEKFFSFVPFSSLLHERFAHNIAYSNSVNENFFRNAPNPSRMNERFCEMPGIASQVSGAAYSVLASPKFELTSTKPF
jgi:hypothetical protein